jgi:hypothetical protein
MSYKQLVERFSNVTVLPIDINDVVQFIVELGFRDDIKFVGVNMEGNGSLFGTFHSYYRPTGVYSEPDVCVDIIYNINLDSKWKRFVCCKELLHIFDSTHAQTKSLDDVERLIDDISSGLNDENSTGWGLHGLSDKLAIFRVMLVLFPRASRDLLIGPYRDGKIKISEIAELSAIPEEFVNFLMQNEYEKIYDTLLNTA